MSSEKIANLELFFLLQYSCQHSENNGEILKSQKGASCDFTQIFNSSRLIKESTVYQWNTYIHVYEF